MTTIRVACETDAPAIAELLAQLGYPTLVADVPGRLAKLHAEGAAVLVAVNEHHEVIGLASAVSFAAMHTNAPVSYITALVTHERVRGQGIGRAMVDSLERWAYERGCPRLSVTSGEQRHDAHSFYSRCGFPYTGKRFTKALDSLTS